MEADNTAVVMSECSQDTEDVEEIMWLSAVVKLAGELLLRHFEHKENGTENVEKPSPSSIRDVILVHELGTHKPFHIDVGNNWEETTEDEHTTFEDNESRVIKFGDKEDGKSYKAWTIHPNQKSISHELRFLTV